LTFEFLQERLSAYRIRLLLAAAGVTVSVAVTTALANLVVVLEASITKGLRGLGSDVVFVMPKEPLGGAARPFISKEDVLPLVRQGYFDSVVPLTALRFKASACGKALPITLAGVEPGNYDLDGWQLRSGRFISEVDVRSRQAVAVLEAPLFTTLTCLADGGHIDVNSRRFTVVGTAERSGFRLAGGRGDIVLVPLTTAEGLFALRRQPSAGLMLRLGKGMDRERAVAALSARLRWLRGVRDGAGDFVITGREDVIRAASSAGSVASSLLGAILVLCLLVAGIGVLNSVLTGVQERTPEIGLRRALGATRRAIGLQFLLESSAVAASGCLLGVLAGLAATVLSCRAIGLPFAMNGPVIGFAATACLICGLAAGIWPALRAAELVPCEALRHE
jgi:ABC-type antimicrobial peptide transport system permease subunit